MACNVVAPKEKILLEKNEIAVKGDKSTMCMIICIFLHLHIIINTKYVDLHDHTMLFLPKHRRRMTCCGVFVGGMVIPNVEELFGVECFVDVRDGSSLLSLVSCCFCKRS